MGTYTCGRIVQVPNVQKNIIQYRIKYDTKKSDGDGIKKKTMYIIYSDHTCKKPFNKNCGES